MVSADQLCQRRNALLEELGGITALRKGYLNEQWFPIVRNNKKTSQLRGPYHVWSYKEGKKTVSKRVIGQLEIEQAQSDAANYARFKELCRELEEILATLGVAQREGAAQARTLKRRRSRSRRSPGCPADDPSGRAQGHAT